MIQVRCRLYKFNDIVFTGRLNEPQSRSVNEIKDGVDGPSFSALQIYLR